MAHSMTQEDAQYFASSSCKSEILPTEMLNIDKIEWNRRKHRIKMVEFRIKKKEKLQELRNEHHRLERVMKKQVSALKCQHQREVYSQLDVVPSMIRAVGELILTKEIVRVENLALHKQINAHRSFQAILYNDESTSHHEGEQALPDTGWWVHFPNCASSFYFQPFQPEDIATIPNPLASGFVGDMPSTALVGTLFGWKVYRELRRSHGQELTSRMRLIKRVNCSLDRAYKVACTREKDLRPLLVTPIGWSSSDHHKASVQVLQEIDPDCCVMVHHIPGLRTIRYVFLERTAQWVLQNGKRRMEFSMIIADTNANKINRDAVIPQEGIDWVCDGWATFKMTEIDDNNIDIVYEHCAACQDEKHAGQLITQWAQFILKWEQFALPSNLLVVS